MGSNRTIVGLKREAMAFNYEMFKKQQSHHCGIETTEQV